MILNQWVKLKKISFINIVAQSTVKIYEKNFTKNNSNSFISLFLFKTKTKNFNLFNFKTFYLND